MAPYDLPKTPEQAAEAQADHEDYEKIRAELTDSGINAAAYNDEFLSWMKNQEAFMGTYDDLMKFSKNETSDDLNGYTFTLDSALGSYEQEQAEAAAPATVPTAPDSKQTVDHNFSGFGEIRKQEHAEAVALPPEFKRKMETLDPYAVQLIAAISSVDKDQAAAFQSSWDYAKKSNDVAILEATFKTIKDAADSKITPAKAPEAAADSTESFDGLESIYDPAVNYDLFPIIEAKVPAVLPIYKKLWADTLESKDPILLERNYRHIVSFCDTLNTPKVTPAPDAATPEVPKAPEAAPSPAPGPDATTPDSNSESNFGVKFKEGSADEATAGEPAAPGAAAPGDTSSSGGSSSGSRGEGSASGPSQGRETASEVDFKGVLKADPDKYVKQETVDGKTKVTLTDVPDRGSRIQHIVGPDGVIKIEADKLATTVLTAGGTEYRWDGSSWTNGGRRLYIGESYAKEFTISEGAPVSVGGSSGGSAGAEKAPEKEASSELLIALPGKPDTYQAAKDIDNLATMVPSIDKYLGLQGSQKLPDRIEKDGVTYTLVRGENVKSDEEGDTATHPGAPIEYRSASGGLSIKQGETFKVYFDAAPAAPAAPAAAPAPATTPATPEKAPEGSSLQKGMQTLIERVIVMPGKEKELVKNVNAKLTGQTFNSLVFDDRPGMGQTVALKVTTPDGTEKTYTGNTALSVGSNPLAGKIDNPFAPGEKIQMNAWNRAALRNLFENIVSQA